MSDNMTVSFIGDISLNDIYISLYKQKINPFESIPSLKIPDSFLIGNLECFPKGDFGENLMKKPRLSTTVETLNYLNQMGVDIVSLANNHIYDHLEDGFAKTLRFLKKNGILHLGAGSDFRLARIPIILKKNNIKVGLLNYVTLDTNPNIPESAEISVNIFEIEKIIKDINEIRGRVDHIVLLLHWGGRVEGGLYPDFDQPKLARQLIDAGADLIIGHHSHTMQPYEVYKGKYIFYSLGNFCFADYEFEGQYNPMPSRRKISTIVTFSFSKDAYSLYPIDYYLNHFQYFEKINYGRQLERRNKVFNVMRKHKIVWSVYYCHKQFILPIILFIQRKDLTLSTKMSRIFKSIIKRLQ